MTHAFDRLLFFFSSRRRHTRCGRDWSSDVCSSDLEPDFSLVKFKELVGGGQMTIVNKSVPLALRTLGYAEPQVEQIDAHIAEQSTIVGAPGLRDEHLQVFDVAVGE